MDHGPRSWCEAWARAATGPVGFWRSASPAAHFRTASTLGPELAEAVAALLLRHPEVVGVLEVGAGDGRLLAALRTRRPALWLAGVDLRERPAGLSTSVGWGQDHWDVSTRAWTTGSCRRLLAQAPGPVLVVAVEWLDDLPCPVVLGGADGGRELDADGAPSQPLPAGAADWLRTWWPGEGRAEVGVTRDEAWAWLVRSLAGSRGGLALVVDYGHERDDRPRTGSLAAYRDGRAVPAVPAPDRNLTAHVAVDAVQAAGERAGARTLVRQRQSVALADLLPPVPTGGVLDVLAARSRRRALTSAGGWGDHWWLLQQVPPPGAGADL
jgi:SAM-dependent MidA family methyltransferase